MTKKQKLLICEEITREEIKLDNTLILDYYAQYREKRIFQLIIVIVFFILFIYGFKLRSLPIYFMLALISTIILNSMLEVLHRILILPSSMKFNIFANDYIDNQYSLNEINSEQYNRWKKIYN